MRSWRARSSNCARQPVCLHEDDSDRAGAKKTVERVAEERERKQDSRAKKLLAMWPQMQKAYAGDEYVVKIRNRDYVPR